MDTLEIERYVITGSLLVGSVLTWYCPCGSKDGKGFLSCHLKEFLAVTTIPIAIALYVNK